MNIFPANAIAHFTSEFVSMLSSNLSNILGVLAFIVALSFIMAIYDSAREGDLSMRRRK